MSFKGNAIAFIDEANITIQAERLGVRIDFKKLLDYLNKNYNLLRAYLYTGLDITSQGGRNFVLMLKRSGYRVVHYRSAPRSDGSVKSNLDIHLAVDMVSMAERYDIAILFSGDGDFIPAIEVISRKGVRVEVISLAERTANELLNIADSFLDLEDLIKSEQLVFQNHREKNADSPKKEAQETKFEKMQQDHQVLTLVQEILTSIPERAFPVSLDAIIRRAYQLDEAGNIEQTLYTSYEKLFNELSVAEILKTHRKEEGHYVESVDFDSLREMVARV